MYRWMVCMWYVWYVALHTYIHTYPRTYRYTRTYIPTCATHYNATHYMTSIHVSSAMHILHVLHFIVLYIKCIASNMHKAYNTLV